jgi:hypothetical protein
MLRNNLAALAAALVLAGPALAGPAASTRAEPAAQPPYSWRGIDGSGVFPARDLVTEFCDYPAEMANDPIVAAAVAKARLAFKPGDRKNIVWRTLLPHWGHNAPVCVKDRVFVLCDEGWKSDAPLLVCLDAKDGKILWQKPVDHMDAWPPDKATVGRECRAKELKRWRDHMTWWNRFYWDNEKHAPAVEDRTEAEWNRLLTEAKKDGWEFPAFADRAMGGPADCGNGAHRSRFGLGVYKGRAGGPTDPDLVKNYERCVREHYYIYPGWTSEGPFYGSTMGSVVSDGEFVYAVTAQEGAACFDLDGDRRWVADLNCGHLPHLSAGVPIANHHSMASPVLADDKLVYYHRDAVAMYGLDKTTGKIAWKADAPTIKHEFRDWKYLKGRKPMGYRGHMTPGGTPVVMRVPEAKPGGAATTVVVSGHGMAVRVSDGRYLGMVRMPLPKDVEDMAGPEEDSGDAGGEGDDGASSTYNSWTAAGDVLYCQNMKGWVYAVRLGVAGGDLKQDVLWRSIGPGDNRDPNLICHADRVYSGPFEVPSRGYSALDARTGRQLACGARPGGYSTSLGAADGKIVMRSSGWKSVNARYTTYRIVDLADLKPMGEGFLAHPKPEGDVAARHIGFLGTPYIAWGVGGITGWGNRLFIRSNDYLWCIGDPAKPFVPPEAVLK